MPTHDQDHEKIEISENTSKKIKSFVFTQGEIVFKGWRNLLYSKAMNLS